MSIPKKERAAIYENLFKEGVMVAKKDFHAPKHPELDHIQNLHVIKAMQVSITLNLEFAFFGFSDLRHYVTNHHLFLESKVERIR